MTPLSTDRQRWQYAIANVGSFKAADRMVRVLGYLGSQGWELVSVYDKASNWFGDFEKGFMLFKREVAPGQVPEGDWCVEIDPGQITVTRKLHHDIDPPYL